MRSLKSGKLFQPVAPLVLAVLCGLLVGACASSSSGAGAPVAEPLPSASAAGSSSAQAADAGASAEVGEFDDLANTMDGFRRLDLPDLTVERPLPLTLEVPETWEVLRSIPAAGVWIGPPGSQPEVSPDMLFVRRSKVDLSKPLRTMQNIRTASERADDWKAADLRVVEISGIEGVLVRMVRGEGDEGRSTFVLKLPLEQGSVDIMAISSNQQFDEFQKLYETMFFSIKPNESMPPRVQPN